MKHYYFKEADSKKRGYNVNVSVWEMIDREFRFIGESDHSTASWRGAKGSACMVLSKKRGHKTDGYKMLAKSVQLHQLP